MNTLIYQFEHKDSSFKRRTVRRDMSDGQMNTISIPSRSFPFFDIDSFLQSKNPKEIEEGVGFWCVLHRESPSDVSKKAIQFLYTSLQKDDEGIDVWFLDMLRSLGAEDIDDAQNSFVDISEKEKANAVLSTLSGMQTLLPSHIKVLQSFVLSHDESLQSKAQDIFRKYQTQFDERLRNDSLSESDMAVILENRSVSESQEDIIQSFHEKVTQVLQNQDNNGLYTHNRYEAYAPWFSVPDQRNVPKKEQLQAVLQEIEDQLKDEKNKEIAASLKNWLVRYIGSRVDTASHTGREAENNEKDTDQDSFEKDAYALQESFQEKIDRYMATNSRIEQVVSHDIQTFSDAEFSQIYTVGKKEMQDIIEQSARQREGILSSWKESVNQSTLQQWIQQYKSDIESERTQALKNIESLRKLDNDIDEKLSETEKTAESALKERNTKQTFKNIKEWSLNGWYFYSLSDIFTMFQQSINMIKEIEAGRKEEAETRLGKQFWGNIGKLVVPDIAEQLEGNFKDKMGGVFGKRIKGFMEAYKRKQPFQLWEIVGKTKNGNELQACLNLLNEMGALRFDDPMLWKAINTIKGYEYMHNDDIKNLSLYEITRKVGTALVDAKVCLPQEFDIWKKTKSGKRENALSEWVGEYDEVSQIGNHDSVMVSMLNNWQKGSLKEADPSRFLSYLVEAFTRGDMSGNPDNRIYYLIQGMVLKNPNGQTLLRFDEFELLLKKFQSKMPYFFFFRDSESWKLNGRIVPEGTIGAEKRNWGYSDFVEWSQFLTDSDQTYNPQKSKYTQERLEEFFDHYMAQSVMAKEVVGRSFQSLSRDADESDAWMYFREWDASNILRLVHVQGASENFLRNFLGAFPGYMRSMKKYIEKGDAEYGYNPEWKKKKEELLQKIGSRLKMALHGTQVLAGNYLGEDDRTEFQIFSADKWKKSIGDKDGNLQDAREKINNAMAKLLQSYTAHGGTKNVAQIQQVLSYNGYEHGDVGRILYNYKEGRGAYKNEADPSHPRYNAAYDAQRKQYKNIERINIDLFHGGDDNLSDIFRDTKAIETMLLQYS